MSSRIAVVPGSFDPPTLGHLDVIRRAAKLYDELHVLIVHNPGKEAMLPISQRLKLTSRFKTTTWILKLLSGKRQYCHFHFSRCVSRIARGSTRTRVSD